MVTMILLTIAMYDGVNITAYERPVGKAYADISECRKAAQRVEGTYPGDAHFSFRISGFCMTSENIEALGFVKGKVKLVGDGASSILEGK